MASAAVSDDEQREIYDSLTKAINMEYHSPQMLQESPKQASNKDNEDKIAMGRTRAKEVREAVDNSLYQLNELKLKELEIEQGLIATGSHPEYHEKLREYESQRDMRLRRASHRLELKKRSAEDFRASCIKEANDSLRANTRILRNAFIYRITREKFNVENEFRFGPSDQAQSKIYGIHPFVLHKRWRTLLDKSLQGNDESDTPDWAMDLVRKRRRSGHSKIWTPPMCIGLNEIEKQEDLSFLNSVIA